MTDAPGSYFVVSRSGRHFVLYARHDAPSLWRVIARFEDGDRAHRYADVENDVLIDDPDYLDDDIAEPIPDIDVPPSAITPENFAKKPAKNIPEIIPASEPVENINSGQQASEATRPEPEAAPAVEADPVPAVTRPDHIGDANKVVEPVQDMHELPEAGNPVTETEHEALDRAFAPVVEKLAKVPESTLPSEPMPDTEFAIDGLKPISGASLLYYNYLCGLADSGETLPSAAYKTAKPAGIKKNSLHWCRTTLEDRGYITRLDIPAPFWVYALHDGRKISSRPAAGKKSIDPAPGPEKNMLPPHPSPKPGVPPVAIVAKPKRDPNPTAPIERSIMDDAMENETPSDGQEEDGVQFLTASQVKARLDSLRKPMAVKQNPFDAKKEGKPKFADAIDDADPAHMTEAIQYMRDAGYEVITVGKARYTLDGLEMTQMQLLSAANNERVRAGLKPLTVPMIDPPSNGGSSLGQAI